LVALLKPDDLPVECADSFGVRPNGHVVVILKRPGEQPGQAALLSLELR
jgi:hypothetical protein